MLLLQEKLLMNLIKPYIAILLLVVVFSACNAQKGSVNNNKTMELKTEIDSVSYGIGINIGRSLAGQGMESLNPEIIAEALNDVLSGGELKMTDEESMSIVNTYMQDVQLKRAQAAKDEGAKFLEKNGKFTPSIISAPCLGNLSNVCSYTPLPPLPPGAVLSRKINFPPRNLTLTREAQSNKFLKAAV